MITLRADNRYLLNDAKYTFLVNNCDASQVTFDVLNTEGFSPNTFVLFGNFGYTQAEILKVASVDAVANKITFSSATVFPHSESTKLTVLQYDQIRFFWTAGTSFGDTNPLSSWFNLQPSSWFTTYDDSTKINGNGWFVYRNSVTQEASQPSNYIPYSDFGRNMVKKIFDDFLSLLNNKELKLVTQADMYSWLNEGYSTVRNKLNLTNVEYSATLPQTLTTTAGVPEYLLPSDFSDLVNLVSGNHPNNAREIEFISIKDAMTYQGSVTKYYLRGKYIGIVPTPHGTHTFYYKYLTKTTRLSTYDDEVDLPDNGEYVIKDWMMYRAKMKFTDPMFKEYFTSFTNGMNMLMSSAIKRDANLDRWGITKESNV